MFEGVGRNQALNSRLMHTSREQFPQKASFLRHSTVSRARWITILGEHTNKEPERSKRRASACERPGGNTRRNSFL